VARGVWNGRNEGIVRNKLREYFEIAPVTRTQLVAPASLAEKPLWSAAMEGEAYTIALSPDEKRIAVGHTSKGVILFDADSGDGAGELPVKGERIYVRFRKADGRLFAVNLQSFLSEWDPVERKLLRGPAAAPLPVHELAMSDACDMIASRNTDSFGVSVWDLARADVRWSYPMRAASGGLLALSPDGSRLAVCDGFAKDILLWDAAKPKPIAKLEGHAGVPNRAFFSSNGEWLVSTGSDSKVLLWDGRSGELRHEYASGEARGSAIAFTGDSKRFIARTEHTKFGIFDCKTGRATHGFHVPGNWVSHMVLSADGLRLFMLVIISDDMGTYQSRVDCWNVPKEK
jgi:WD40 repeat protein